MPYQDRKSTRLNSSHGSISYAVFCLKKKKTRRNFTLGTSALAALPLHQRPRDRALVFVVGGGVRAPSLAARGRVGGLFFFFLMNRRPPRSPLFPSPALFR